jgi:hypothetical protein
MMTRHFRQSVFLLTWIAVVLAFAACAPWRVEYLESSLEQDSQAELIHKFGYPQRFKRLPNGDQLWEYDFLGRGDRCASYVLTFDTQDQLRQWERRDCR